MSGYAYLDLDIDKGLATVTINRPERLNTLDALTHLEMERIWPDLAERDEVEAVILRGAEGVFSAGGDVKDMLARVTADPSAGSGISPAQARRLVNAILDFDKPLIAAVEGRAAGLGATIALLCDFVVAADDAWFSDPHVDVALVPGDGGAAVWTVFVGPHRAKSVLLTGGVVPATAAHDWGLVHEISPAGQTYPAAVALARHLLTRSRQAVLGTKVSINTWIKVQFQPILETSLAFERASLQGADFAEALAALQERRPPDFSNRS